VASDPVGELTALPRASSWNGRPLCGKEGRERKGRKGEWKDKTCGDLWQHSPKPPNRGYAVVVDQCVT